MGARPATTTWRPTSRKFIELYCSADKAQKNAEQCTTLNKVQVDILRLKAQELVELADKNGGAEALKKYGDGGTAYFEMFPQYCQDPIEQRAAAAGGEVRRIAYNAARRPSRPRASSRRRSRRAVPSRTTRR